MSRVLRWTHRTHASPRRGHPRGRPNHPLLTGIALLMLLAGTVSPIFDGVTLAQTVTPDPNQPTEASDQATEEPTVDMNAETPTPTATVMNELLGAVNIAYWECPNGVDPATVQVSNLESTCTDKRNGVTFAITDGNGATQTQDTGYYDDSQIGFTEIPIGPNIVFGQTQPAPSTVVLCDGIVQHGGPETGTMQLTVSNGMVSWNMKDDEIVFCNWYVSIPSSTTATTTSGSPTAPGAPTEAPTMSGSPTNELLGAVSISYRECPTGVDPATVPSSDIEATCTGSRNGVTFAITDGNGNTQTQDTGFYDDSSIGFNEIPIGPNITFGQTVPATSAVVFCDGIVQHGGPETGYQLMTVTNGMVSWNMQDDEIVFCDWYVSEPDLSQMTPTGTPSLPTATPSESPAPGTPTDTSGTPVNQLVGSINVNYRECPATFDLSNPPSDPATACTTMRNGVQFDLTTSSNQSFSQLTGYFDDSVVSFTEMPTGMTKVTQNPAAGQTLVICDGIVQHGGPETGDITMPVTNGSISWDLKDDEIVGCNWYVSGVGGAGAQPASFAISGFICPSGFNINASDEATTAASCTTPYLGLRFDLGPSGGTGSPRTVLTDNNGLANFGDVVPGSYTLKRYPVPNNSFVYCHSATNPQFPFTASSLGGIDLSLDPGVAVTCAWYETAQTAGTGTVYINKHACPASYVPSSPANIYDLALNCHDDAGAVQFSLTTGQTTQNATTGGAPNAIEFQNVATGLVIVTENVPQGYGAPIVTCKGMSLTDDPTVEVPSSLMTVTANTITWNLVNTQTMFCDWYNMPTGYGEILINKHACPPDYMVPNPVDPYDLALKCHDDAGPVVFNIANGAYTANQTTGGAPNMANFTNVPSGVVSMTETIPTGFTTPIVYCKATSLTQDPNLEVPYTLMTVANGTTTWNVRPDQMVYCDWWNVHQPQTYTITIYKYTCGDDPSYYMTNGAPDYQKFTTLCTNPMPGVNFTASQGGTPVATATSSNSNPFSLSNLPVKQTTVSEEIPSGYGDPYVFCGDVYSPMLYTSTGGAITLNPTTSGNIVCSWYNMPDGPGSITVYKWMCPDGYDWTLPSANPKMDCDTPVNGVTFSLKDTGSNTNMGQTNTGDSIPYAIFFGGLKIGDYMLTETVPDGIGGIFVLDCDGLYTGSIHPSPLWTGNDFPFHVGSHDQIVCNWYNVPSVETGSIVINKAMCTTTTWTSAVNCDTWEYGSSFKVTSGASTVGQGTTDAWGKLAINNLAAGVYVVTETSGTPCHVESRIGDGQNAVVNNGNVTVQPGLQTTVWVYNCAAKPTPGTTPQPTPGKGKPPGKYPNTGVDPNAAKVPLSAQDTTVIEPETGTPSDSGTPQSAACTELKDGTPTAATPEEGVRCGAIPLSISAPAIKLDAKIEVLETVNGEMQDPTTPDQAAWYKETSRLGEGSNTVMAGHLNYWGVPEGVFFAIDKLQTGDTITITGDDGTAYTYVVDWVKQVDATTAPGNDIVGETPQSSLTLMTCGGPWNSATSEYTERTVVRAHLVGTGPAPAATPQS